MKYFGISLWAMLVLHLTFGTLIGVGLFYLVDFIDWVTKEARKK